MKSKQQNGYSHLSMNGHIRCSNCGSRRNESVCPKCLKPNCKIYVYWKGKEYYFRKFYIDDLPLDYERAQRQLNAIRTDIDKRTFSPEDWQPRRAKELRLETQAEVWLDQKEEEAKRDELSHETLKNYRGYVKIHFKFFNGMDVREIKREQLENFKSNLPSSLKIKTRRNIMNALHALFNWMHRRETIERVPPFPTIEGDDATERKAIDYQTQNTALETIPEEHRDVIEFAFETGLRPGELCALKIKDLNLKDRQALIQRTWSGSHLRETTKGKNKRWIPLSDRAFEIAKRKSQLKLPETFLFINPNTRGPYRQKVLNNIWKGSTGCQTVFYEASRHSFCTQIIDNGADVLQAKALLRHSDIRSTQKYYHGSSERLRSIVNQRGQKVPFKDLSEGSGTS